MNIRSFYYSWIFAVAACVVFFALVYKNQIPLLFAAESEQELTLKAREMQDQKKELSRKLLEMKDIFLENDNLVKQVTNLKQVNANLTKENDKLQELENSLKREILSLNAKVSKDKSLEKKEPELAYGELYERMDSKKAAKIMDDMNLETVSKILKKMKIERASEVISKMAQDKARLLTEKYLVLDSH